MTSIEVNCSGCGVLAGDGCITKRGGKPRPKGKFCSERIETYLRKVGTIK